MKKTLIKHGNSLALVIDKPILELLQITADHHPGKWAVDFQIVAAILQQIRLQPQSFRLERGNLAAPEVVFGHQSLFLLDRAIQFGANTGELVLDFTWIDGGQ